MPLIYLHPCSIGGIMTKRTVRETRIWYAFDLLLLLMITGPILAPLFHLSGLWLFDRIAHWIIYPLGMWICPQDQHTLPIMGQAMSVCSRCYAAIGGLFLVRLALTSDVNEKGVGAWLARRWHERQGWQRLTFILAIISVWQFDIWAERLGWWSWGQGMLIATGPIVGLAIGFLVYGLLAQLTSVRPAWQ